MHLNTVQLIGRVGKNGPRLNYASSGAPTCSFTLEVDELGKGGEVFVLYLPVELWGHAESAAETLEAGDEVMLSGKLKYKSAVDKQTQQKTSKLIISSWGISQRQPAETSPSREGILSPRNLLSTWGILVSLMGKRRGSPLPRRGDRAIQVCGPSQRLEGAVSWSCGRSPKAGGG